MASRNRTRNRVKNAVIRKDPMLLDYLIEAKLRQQEEILARKGERLYASNSPFYGVPKVIAASSPVEAAARVEWYEEPFKDTHGVSTGRCHQILRS